MTLCHVCGGSHAPRKKRERRCAELIGSARDH